MTSVQSSVFVLSAILKNSVCKPVAIKYFWRAWSLSHPLITQRILHPTGPLRHSFNPIPKPQIWASPPATNIDRVTTGVRRCSNVVKHRLKAFLSLRTKEISSVGSERGNIAVYVMSSRCLISHLLFTPEMLSWICNTYLKGNWKFCELYTKERSYLFFQLTNLKVFRV